MAVTQQKKSKFRKALWTELQNVKKSEIKRFLFSCKSKATFDYKPSILNPIKKKVPWSKIT